LLRNSRRFRRRTSPAFSSESILAVSAEKKTSAGAPAAIWRARSLEEPNEKRTRLPVPASKARPISWRASVRLAAAKTRISSPRPRAAAVRESSGTRPDATAAASRASEARPAALEMEHLLRRVALRRRPEGDHSRYISSNMSGGRAFPSQPGSRLSRRRQAAAQALTDVRSICL
jgi:hypothetical protein